MAEPNVPSVVDIPVPVDVVPVLVVVSGSPVTASAPGALDDPKTLLPWPFEPSDVPPVCVVVFDEADVPDDCDVKDFPP
ncbi:MAG: hypothetical protein AAF637_18630, partial [Pseudomonadota bacterium]